jgi:Family of unknown function (DUF6499)
MPQVSFVGTAWNEIRQRYSYLDQLDRAGLVWEFLRRDPHYTEAYKNHILIRSPAEMRQKERSHTGPKPFAAWGLVRFRGTHMDCAGAPNPLGWTVRQPCCRCANIAEARRTWQGCRSRF